MKSRVHGGEIYHEHWQLNTIMAIYIPIWNRDTLKTLLHAYRHFWASVYESKDFDFQLHPTVNRLTSLKINRLHLVQSIQILLYGLTQVLGLKYPYLAWWSWAWFSRYEVMKSVSENRRFGLPEAHSPSSDPMTSTSRLSLHWKAPHIRVGDSPWRWSRLCRFLWHSLSFLAFWLDAWIPRYNSAGLRRRSNAGQKR